MPALPSDHRGFGAPLGSGSAVVAPIVLAP
jgi:hypothetical protein